MSERGKKTGEYIICQVCSETKYVFPSDLKRGFRTKFCSRKCNGIWMKKNKITAGKNNAMWKRGYNIQEGGRCIINVNGKKVPRARYVWMSHNNYFPIPKGFIIHHKNLDPSDDNINNLILLPDSIHKSLHIALRCST